MPRDLPYPFLPHSPKLITILKLIYLYLYIYIYHHTCFYNLSYKYFHIIVLVHWFKNVYTLSIYFTQYYVFRFTHIDMS